MNTQWFRERLRDKKISQRKLAAMINIDPAAVSLMLRSKRRMSPAEAHRMAQILGQSVTEVLRQAGIEVTDDITRVPIRGYMTDEGIVHSFAEKTHEFIVGPADCPSGTFALQVRSPNSIKDGWILFISPDQVSPEDNIDHLCLCATEKGKQTMGVVRRGYRANTFNLVTWPDMQNLTDQDFVWTGQVFWIKPR